MPSVSESVMPGTWVRRLSSAVDFRYNSDGNSSNYSSVEDNHRIDKQYVPSFMINDDLSGRSYVDPWDMENYSFLRKQLEDINLSDNELSPAFESTQSDFYYVPLDHKGSPQYQYKHYVDAYDFQDDFSPQPYGDDDGLMANIDEYDFYNEHLDSMLHDDSYMEFSNPSRQSERSRFNNQDYHTYTPPSIVKGFSDIHALNQVPKLRRRASAVTFRPDTFISDLFIGDDNQKTNQEWRQNGKKSLSDVKIKLNRRKSIHVLSGTPDLKFGKIERRKSVLDHPHKWQTSQMDKWQTLPVEIIPERKTKEKLEKRKSGEETSTELRRKPIRSSGEGILQRSENKGSRLGLNVSFHEGDLQRKKHSGRHPNTPLVYVYETARRRRKMFLPNSSSKTFREDDFRSSITLNPSRRRRRFIIPKIMLDVRRGQRVGILKRLFLGRGELTTIHSQAEMILCDRPEIQDVFSLDPIEQFLNRPTSRYTMTSYGHLKIDYSCSWNYLDKCIAQRVCL